MGKTATPTPVPSKVKELDDDEARRILTAIARTSTNDAARIAAIKGLREMRKEGVVAAAPQAKEGFDALDEVATKRSEKSA